MTCRKKLIEVALPRANAIVWFVVALASSLAHTRGCE